MSVCNPGYCCCASSQNLTTKIPTTLLSGCCQIKIHGPSFFCTFMSDTVGVVWRAASGTVDPWTKNAIVCCAKQSLVKASAGTMSCAQAENCAQTTATKVLTSGKADPSQFYCGLKNSVCLTKTSFEKIIIAVVILAIAVILISNTVTRR